MVHQALFPADRAYPRMTYGFDGVTVAFDGQIALKEIDLDIEPGQVTVVIGADGAGKTTTARTMVGLLDPLSGTVHRPPDIGYQPEASGAWSDLTVGENLSLVATAHRLREAEQRKRALLEATNLTAAADRLAENLSGGMRQKLAVAMAMLAQPSLIVLDEPTTGLDPMSRAELWRLLSMAAGEGAAVLITTAYLNEAERASQVLVLDDGATLASGTASQIRASFPGTVSISESRPATGHSWRRGRNWRVWSPEGSPPSEGVVVEPDLADVVTLAALTKKEGAPS
ncbi:MAG: ATP-binding cassette domain-containing protein [Acidimicrobiia bacterium]|nr:ATP-binding cassette domain-containing protein [Acidimicrobiia bacterium]